MMIIRIEPLDTFFLRDGKPFSLGQETWADGMFPPSPSILYGALRAIYFSEHLNEFSKANTDKDPTRDLRINGIFLEIGDQSYLPVPADCVTTKDKNGNESKRLLTINRDDHPSSKETHWITTVNHHLPVKDIGNNNLFEKGDYLDYLNGEAIDRLPYRILKDYLQDEPKVAFKKSDLAGTIEEENLHRVGARRFKEDSGKVRIMIDFENLEISKQGFMKLVGNFKRNEV